MGDSEANTDKRDTERSRELRVRLLLNASQEIDRRRNHMGYTPDDVERLIHETRREEEAESRE